MIEPDAYGGYAPDVQTAIQRFNSKRSSTRNESKVNDFSHDRIQRSFQDSKVNNNLTKLQSLMRSSSGTLFKKMQCTDNSSGDFTCSCRLQSAYWWFVCQRWKSQRICGLPRWAEYIYWCHRTYTLDVREDDLRARFRDAILDKNHGLHCILFKHINGHHYIILDNDEFDMVPFLQDDEMVKQMQIRSYFHSLTSDFM